MAVEPTLTLNTRYPSVDQMVNIAQQASNDQWVIGNYFEFLRLDTELAFANSKLDVLKQHFQGRAGILKMHPYRMYNWHTDSERNVAVNVLLTSVPSWSFHGYYTPNPQQTRIKVVDYGSPGTCVLFDTQRSHCVINLEQTRLVLTLSFSKKFTYAQVHSFCIQNQI